MYVHDQNFGLISGRLSPVNTSPLASIVESCLWTTIVGMRQLCTVHVDLNMQ